MKKRNILLGLALVLLLLIVVGAYFLYLENLNGQTTAFYLAGDSSTITLSGKEGISRVFIRGSLVDIKKKTIEIDGIEYNQFDYDNETYYVLPEYLKENRQDCMLTKKVYALRDHVLTSDYDDYHINGFVFKKDELSITSYHELLDNGEVDYYYVNDTGYISSKYVANEFYETSYDASIYKDVFFNMGGDPTKIDYYPKEEINFVDNKMPEIVRALYINAEGISNAQSYLDIARDSKINAFVIDIKDCYIDTQLAYDSLVAKKYAPSTSNIPNSLETFKKNVKLIKDAGYYIIGRITAFKDDAFAKDNPDEALLYNGDLYRYGSVNWPSAYSLKMWEYNMALANEAIDLFDFNEIQFDYIRFPEDADENIDLRNKYNMSRCQVVSDFLRYASEFLHQKQVYLSADVFGETSGDDDGKFSCFVSYYGQFWPAISNCVDAISSMPYPDHFGNYFFGISEPWLEPGRLMSSWAKATNFAQSKTYDPGKCRTWIMAQNSDSYNVEYTADFIKQQIDGLKEGGVYDGFMTWNAASSTYKYNQYIDVLD